MTDLAALDATATAALITAKEASPEEVVAAAIERAQRLNPQLNAIIHERYDKALAEAAGPLPDGPLRGVPVVVKDLDGWLAGEPWHGGMRAMKDANWQPPNDSALFRRLKDAGCVIIGKTNTPELGLVPSSECDIYGPTHNPWDPAHSPGGSSGGSAAAVAARIVAAGHAGDGGGSIRIPASECGLVGLKPSRGRVSLAPEAAQAWDGLVARLMVTRTVRDTALFLDVLAGEEPGDPYTAPLPARPYVDEVGANPGTLRVGVATDAPGGFVTDPAVKAIVDQTASLLAELGHAVSDTSPAALAEDLSGIIFPIIGAATARDLEELGEAIGRALTESDVEPHTWATAELGRTMTGTQHLAAVSAAHAYTRRMVAWFDDCDVLVTPTIPELPPTLGQFTAEPGNPLAGMFRAGAVVPFTMPFNVTGLPAISLPLGMSASGLPIGVQFVAAPHREDVLIRLAAQLEAAAPWADRRPGISA
ncbi:MAG: amidase [Actinomycetota bacterium]